MKGRCADCNRCGPAYKKLCVARFRPLSVRRPAEALCPASPRRVRAKRCVSRSTFISPTRLQACSPCCYPPPGAHFSSIFWEMLTCLPRWKIYDVAWQRHTWHTQAILLISRFFVGYNTVRVRWELCQHRTYSLFLHLEVPALTPQTVGYGNRLHNPLPTSREAHYVASTSTST